MSQTIQRFVNIGDIQMKKFSSMALIVGLVSVVNIAYASGLDTVCRTVRTSCDYNARYDLIDLVFRTTGQVLFDKESNPYTRNMVDDDGLGSDPPRFYIGTTEQNAKLARNISANKALFRNGILTDENAKKWEMVP